MGSLVGWMRDQGMLRGPLLFADYWASVLRMPGRIRNEHVREGLVDPFLYRLGVDRPELEVPRLRHYLLLFLVGPFLLPFRGFRRLGRYRLSYRSRLGEEVADRLRELQLELTPAGPGRVDVHRDGRRLAEDVLDPYGVYGFASLFYATYKLPLASLTAMAVAVGAALLARGTGPAAEAFQTLLRLWLPVGFPLLVGLLYLLYREWVTAVLGALAGVAVRYLIPLLVSSGGGWGELALAAGGFFALYMLVDWFFMPRPVPPALLLYTSREPGRPYERRDDAPWWLEGEAYWVWRYLILTPAELNKFWERDWERVELWIRADGEEMGMLEWVVTDGHYRELWIPYGRLGTEDRLARQRREAREALREGKPAFWLLEADADLVFHTPFFRGVTLVPEQERFPARSVWHVVSSLWKQAGSDDPDDYREQVDAARLRRGRALFEDVPEAASGHVARHLLSMPWRYWRYPLGAAARRERLVYGNERDEEPPPAAEPELQVKKP